MSGTPNIQENNLSGSLKDVRKKLACIDPFEADITILALQPGIGKSTWVRKYCNNHDEIEGIGVFSPRHNLLEEFKGFNHWKGIRLKCPRREESWIKKLLEIGLNASVICSICGRKKKCPYHEQFKDTNRVTAPHNYLATNYVDPINLFFVEEEMYQYRTFEFNKDIIKKALAFIDPDYIDLVLYRKYTDDDVEYIKKRRLETLRIAAENEDYEVVQIVNQFDPQVLEYCQRREVYYLPRIFRLFDLSKIKSIVMLQASFHQYTFERLLQRYENEYWLPEEMRIEVYRSRVQNKNTKIYKITNSDYSKNVINRYRNEEIDSLLKKIVQAYGQDQVFVITSKEYISEDLISGKYVYKGIDAKWFGNISGLNEFEDKKVEIVIGTYRMPVKEFTELYNRLFDEEVNAEEINVHAEVLSYNKEQFTYKGTPLEEFEGLEVLTQYDVIHRSRGLLNDRIIFVFGLVPEDCQWEFEYKMVKKEEAEDIIRKLGIQYHNEKLNETIEKVRYGYKKGWSFTKIARYANLRDEKGKYDTEWVKKAIEYCLR